jgi:hypothetical protein
MDHRRRLVGAFVNALFNASFIASFIALGSPSSRCYNARELTVGMGSQGTSNG